MSGSFYRPRNKYNASRASFNGKVYHSRMERDDAIWLHDLVLKKEITELKEQVRYRIIIKGVDCGSSIVDFQFKARGKKIWYETKGMLTDLYKFKRRCIEADLSDNSDEVYIVNAKDLEHFLRGRLS